MESENNKDQQQNAAVSFRNELINQEKFLKAAKRFLEQEMLCLQIDEMKLRARMRAAQMKVENIESDDDDYKEEVACNVREGSNSHLASSSNPYAIQIKEEPLDTEEKSSRCAGSSQSLMTQSNSASNVHGCRLSGTPGRIGSPSGFEDYPSIPDARRGVSCYRNSRSVTF